MKDNLELIPSRIGFGFLDYEKNWGRDAVAWWGVPACDIDHYLFRGVLRHLLKGFS